MPGAYEQGGHEPGRLPLPPELSPRGRKGAKGAPPARSPRRRLVRAASWVSVTASVLVLILAGAAFAYYEQLNGNVHRVPGVAAGDHKAAATQDGAENILIFGRDDRSGATAAQLAEANTGNDGGSDNTDTIMILHLAPGGGPATLISFPRDSYVDIPGHGMNKINAAYVLGENAKKGTGAALLTQTLEQMSGLRIDHFVQVSFFQFIDISNAIGGVNVCVSNPNLKAGSYVDYPIDRRGPLPSEYAGGAFDLYSGTKLTQGVHSISGGAALAFVRQRHNLPNGDIDRIKRQQRFITAVVQKARQESNPLTINAVLQKLTGSITVDDGLGGLDLIKLGNRLRGLDPSSIRFVTVPIANENASARIGKYNASIVQLDTEKMATFFANIRAERDPNAVAPAPTTSTAPPANPSDTHVIVQNGSGVNGVAARAKTKLESYGFVVDSTGTTSASSTTIRYNGADAGMAAELKKAVPNATLQQDDSVTSGAVVLTLASSRATIQDPASASSTPTPSTTSSSGGDTTTVTTAAGGGNEIDGVPCGP